MHVQVPNKSLQHKSAHTRNHFYALRITHAHTHTRGGCARLRIMPLARFSVCRSLRMATLAHIECVRFAMQRHIHSLS